MNRRTLGASKVNEACVLTFRVDQAEPIIQEAFADRKARVLWLGIKGSHIVDNHFNENCLKLSGWIGDMIVNGRWLSVKLQDLGVIGSQEDYGDQLAPYINGWKEIAWSEKVEA